MKKMSQKPVMGYRIVDELTGYALHGVIDSKQSHSAIWKPIKDMDVAKRFSSAENAIKYAERVGLYNLRIIDDLGTVVAVVQERRIDYACAGGV